MSKSRRTADFLVFSIWVGLALILLTPFLVTPQTLFPFVVGKALYTRTIIELVFGLWVALLVVSNRGGQQCAMAKHQRGASGLADGYFPPRSWLLVLLAVSLGVGVLAALFGVSLKRSLWSTYERMGGLVDTAHWLAFTVVVASVLRRDGDWRVLLNLNLGASLVVALLAVGQRYAVDVPFFGALPERNPGRIGTVFGNATYLGIYMLMNLLVALGFLARSVVSVAGPLPADGRRHWSRLGAGGRPVARAFWVVVAGLDLWALILSGSAGSVAGLLAGLAVPLVCYVFLAPTRLVRGIAIGSVSLVAVVSLAVLAWFFIPHDEATDGSEDPSIARQLLQPSARDASTRYRLLGWQAGLRGFAERPLLGWGPENFLVVFGRYVSKDGEKMTVHNRAHSQIVEELATKGALGLLGYLAVWGFTLFVLIRAARRLEPGEQALTLFVGAALVGYFAQSQTLFDSPVSCLQYALLLAFAGSREMELAPAREPWAMPRRKGIAAIALTITALVVGGGLFANYGIWSGARPLTGLGGDRPSEAMDRIEQAIAAFEPLASRPRITLFLYAERQWPTIRSNSGEAQRLLELVDKEARRALANEPRHWLMHYCLMRAYRAIASSEAGYVDRAIHHRRLAQALAPERYEPREPFLAPPDSIRGPYISATGSYTLTWGGVWAATAYRLEERSKKGPWTILADTTVRRMSFRGKVPGVYSYRVAACLDGDDCGLSTPPKTVIVGTAN